jgi:hypothetical protein
MSRLMPLNLPKLMAYQREITRWSVARLNFLMAPVQRARRQKPRWRDFFHRSLTRGLDKKEQ